MSRIVAPNLTGFYEHLPAADGQNAALTLQLNQAGRALVGWFAAPPEFVNSRAALTAGPGTRFGVLAAALGLVTTEETSFIWSGGDASSDGFNPLDPDDLGASIHVGRLCALRGGRGAWQLLAVAFSPADAPDLFLRVRPHARWPRTDLGFFPEPVRSALLAQQTRPLPTTYVDRLRRRVAGEDPATEALTAPLLRRWYAAPADSSQRKIARAAIEVLLDDPALRLASPYRQAIAAQLRQDMASRSLRLGSERRRYLDWYQDVFAEEVAGAMPGTGDLEDPGPRGIFARLGIGQQGQFAYTFTFEDAGFAAKASVGAGAYLLNADVTKEFLTFMPQGVQRRPVWTTNQPGRPGPLFGFRAEVGLGYAAKAPSLPGRPRSAPGSLGTVEFRSSTDLDSAARFNGAWFRVSVLRGPGASMGRFTSVDSFTSTFWVLTLDDGREMTSELTTGFALRPPSLPRYRDLVAPDEFAKKWFQARPEARMADFSASIGWLVYVSQGRLPIDVSEPPLPKAPEQEAAASAVPEVFFDWSAGRFANDLVRLELEMALAINQILFTLADAQLRVYGYASPEGERGANTALSEKRAAAVVQAITDAFGAELTIKDIKVYGLGEQPALDAGLENPPPAGPAFEAWVAANPDQVDRWPQWRRVDVRIAGKLIVRVAGREGSRGRA